MSQRLGANLLFTVFDGTAAAAVNHLLRTNAWARERLLPFAGKTARFNLFPTTCTLTVRDNGEVGPATSEVAPDVTLTAALPVAMRALGGDEEAWNAATVDGDTAFAQEIGYLVRHLKWDIEEDLSHVVGDVAAHRMAESGRALNRWREQAGENIAQAFAEYWTEERPLIAKRRDVEQFNHDVDTLRDDVERLEKRMEMLATRQAAGDIRKDENKENNRGGAGTQRKRREKQ
jgi:ubiquinone biosynthesis protein UbiJ